MLSFTKLFFFALMSFVYTSNTQGQTVNWTQFEHLPDSLRKETKPILIFVHTDWCKYCQMQKTTTFHNDSITQILNNTFYTLQLNAESKSPIEFLGRTYTNDGKIHSLASFIAKKDGLVTFPTTVIFSPNQQLIFREASYLDQDTFLLILRNITF